MPLISDEVAAKMKATGEEAMRAIEAAGLSGVDHLKGETVAVVADGEAETNQASDGLRSRDLLRRRIDGLRERAEGHDHVAAQHRREADNLEALYGALPIELPPGAEIALASLILHRER